MLQKTYGIYSEETGDRQLIIEAGKNHLACWCKNPGEHRVLDFEFFLCDDRAVTSFSDVLKDARSHSRLLARGTSGVTFIWNSNEAICLPINATDHSESFVKDNFDFLFGSSLNTGIFSEQFNDYLTAVRIDKDLPVTAQDLYPGAAFHTQYGCLLPGLKWTGSEGAEIVYVHFYPRYFSIVVFKDAKLQLAQTRSYNIPEDVLYFVLNAFTQYEVEKKVEIVVGGFIDEQSKLYELLYQYLEGLKLAQPDETRLGSPAFKEYSSHYFLPYANYLL